MFVTRGGVAGKQPPGIILYPQPVGGFIPFSKMHKNYIKMLCILTKTILQKSLDSVGKRVYNRVIETERGRPQKEVSYEEVYHSRDYEIQSYAQGGAL